MHNILINRHRKNQNGISIVIVIFILAVVSVIGLSIASISGTQHFTSLLSYRNAQAYLAARAGVDYALSRINAGASCGTIDASLNVQGHTVAIVCAVTPSINEGNPSAAYVIYSLSATASRGNFSTPEVANRIVRATIKFP